jgi:membrane peptidoglycan carboxypeptidase
MMQYLVGVEQTAKFAESMGIASKKYILAQDPGLSIGLGSIPVSLTNMTAAYGVFAQQGTLHPATAIMEIRDRNNRVIYTRDKNGVQPSKPMTKAEAYLTHWILEGNTNPKENSVWGSRAELDDPNGDRRHAGFKTGTTNDFRDVSGFGYVPGSLVTGVWMGNNNQEPMSNEFGGLFSADGPLYLWHDFMETALNKRWDWNGHKPVPQTDFAQPTGVVTQKVCKYSGMAAIPACGETRELPFLEGTVPEPDNLHTKGCFDVEQGVRDDDRRPQEWIDSAHLWADRLVNGQLGSVGDATELKEHPNYRLSIAPVPGNSGYGQPICGQRRFTPKPAPTHGSGGPTPSDCPRGNPRKCTPEPTLPGDPSPTGATGGTSVAVLVPAFGLSLIAWLVPLAIRMGRRRPRGGGRVRESGAWLHRS